MSNLELMKPKFVSDDNNLLDENYQVQHDIFEKKKLNSRDIMRVGTLPAVSRERALSIASEKRCGLRALGESQRLELRDDELRDES
ncbi:hypothetical protein H5410_042316 [Solanum commersonii]|uniref:Uncharacterized protein n=1 Tax=Solanum commersonii TaxID=4109 RepID=A0A9J5XVN8_SOLCO|nr:hypothetical protein H5410_042316 [Solanum commersonii]